MKPMQIVIKFVNPVKKGKVLHNLRHVKKITPAFKSCVPKICNHKFSLLDETQKEICSCKLDFSEEGQIFVFYDFGGNYLEELEKMFTRNLVEEIGEKASVKTYIGGKKLELYYDLDNFFVTGKDKVYQLSSDGERLL